MVYFFGTQCTFLVDLFCLFCSISPEEVKLWGESFDRLMQSSSKFNCYSNNILKRTGNVDVNESSSAFPFSKISKMYLKWRDDPRICNIGPVWALIVQTYSVPQLKARAPERSLGPATPGWGHAS